MSSGVEEADPIESEVEKHMDLAHPKVSRAGWKGVLQMWGAAAKTFNLPFNDDVALALANCLLNYENCKENLPCPPE